MSVQIQYNIKSLVIGQRFSTHRTMVLIKSLNLLIKYLLATAYEITGVGDCGFFPNDDFIPKIPSHRKLPEGRILSLWNDKNNKTRVTESNDIFCVLVYPYFQENNINSICYTNNRIGIWRTSTCKSIPTPSFPSFYLPDLLCDPTDLIWS